MNEIDEKFGNRIRIRVCGLLYDQEKILLINHSGVNKGQDFWAPPGGGLELGETLFEALQREFKEETGIHVMEAHFKFVNEFIGLPLHAIELFFQITRYSGKPELGYDPELNDDQIIKDLKYVTFQELWIMEQSKKHNILHNHPTKADIDELSGHIMFNLK